MHCKLVVNDSLVLVDLVFDLKCIELTGSCLRLINKFQLKLIRYFLIVLFELFVCYFWNLGSLFS